MRAAQWSVLARRYLAPALPGRWLSIGNHLVRVPCPHLAWYVSRQPGRDGGFHLEAMIQPLYVDAHLLVGDLGLRLATDDGGHPAGTGRFSAAYAGHLLAHPDLFMPDVVGLVVDRALPYLRRYGADPRDYLDLFHDHCASTPYGRGTAQIETRRAATCLLLGDLEGAREAYRNVLAEALSCDGRMPAWLRHLVGRATERLDMDDEELGSVGGSMRRTEERMRRRWKLPAPEHEDRQGAGSDGPPRAR